MRHFFENKIWLEELNLFFCKIFMVEQFIGKIGYNIFSTFIQVIFVFVPLYQLAVIDEIILLGYQIDVTSIMTYISFTFDFDNR